MIQPLQLFVPWLICASLAVADITSWSKINFTANSLFVPNRFLVELADTSRVPEEHGEKRRPHDIVYEALKKRNVELNIDREFHAEGIFSGFAITVRDSQDLQAIADVSNVAAIRPVVMLERPKCVTKGSSLISSPNSHTGALSTHVMTGVNKLHAEDITGNRIKIGIIDSGIDYNHPLLGEGFGPGYKVSSGWDFVGDDYDGSNTPAEGPDPYDKCCGHGTHVAGIIGANPGGEFNIKGVAYNASLSAYRISSCQGYLTDDLIVAALERGAKEGQDILTISLGVTGPASGWAESTSAVVASRIAAKGTIVIAGIGNDGDIGSWYSSSPADGMNVISVAAVDNTVIPSGFAIIRGVKHDPIPCSPFLTLSDDKSLPIFATSIDTTIMDDACNPLPDDTPDLSAYLVVVRTGTCTHERKLENIANKGGNVILIYGDRHSVQDFDMGSYKASFIDTIDGEFLFQLVQQFATGSVATVTFSKTSGISDFPFPNGGLISSFSSYGPSNDLFFKPAIAAPGSYILSTLPMNLGGYGVMTGTSFSTPFIAGSAALLLQAKGKSHLKDVAIDVRTLLETTGRPLRSSHSDKAPLQTVSKQGAGLINVYNAVRYQTVVTPGELLLNDTAHLKGVHTITIRNTAREPQTYNVSHVPAGTADTINPRRKLSNDGPVPLTPHSASIILSEETFTLPAGAIKTVVATISPPMGVDHDTFPVYSGFIMIKSDTESLHVTYMGLAASLKNKHVVDDGKTLGLPLPALLDMNHHIQEYETEYTFIDRDIPTLLFRLAFGTPKLRIDLVDPKIDYTPTLNPKSVSGRIPHQSGDSFIKVPIVGSIFEMKWASRNHGIIGAKGFSYLVPLQEAKFLNKTPIPNGDYRFLLSALRVTGDPSRDEDIETWLSPVIGVNVLKDKQT
ncbi:hypothetical protein AMATHDRAFT_7712 [Amanita thiersii Skay4041]|uniref:Peptidase S8/S53 domain-containing protein n=1 Tax=Amanita thiersii Skay4041 TaxID=703135 RepID=A0A2A9NFH2_9AGAR|nr:hypothetical protein AMATHDRAFT_7712 [Amanita thiersii Skay4041]